MEFRTLGRTGWQVSAISMGCWNIGGQWGDVSETDAMNTLRRATDLGVNLFDTADAYGQRMGVSEEFLGKAFAGMRDKVYLVTKVGNWARRYGQALAYTSPLHVQLCCDASLHRLRTDHIDVYLCHIGDLREPNIFLDAFEKLKQQGKIRAYGISTNSLEGIARFNQRGSCDVVQLDYSILNREPEKTSLPYCQEHNIGTMVRGVLAMGVLSGKFTRDTRFTDQVRQGWNQGAPREQFVQMVEKVERLKPLVKDSRTLAQTALQYVLAHPAVHCAIPGAKNPDQMEVNARAADVKLGAEELEAIRGAVG
jgi:myo-inositol catabolism protein IolS